MLARPACVYQAVYVYLSMFSNMFMVTRPVCVDFTCLCLPDLFVFTRIAYVYGPVCIYLTFWCLPDLFVFTIPVSWLVCVYLTCLCFPDLFV